MKVRPLLEALLLVGVGYIALSTVDVNFGQIPLKLFALAVALCAWVLLHGREPGTMPRFAFGPAVLIAAILVPSAWFVLTLWLAVKKDPAQAGDTFYAVQHGSRFAYLLLYFPLADALRRDGDEQGARLFLVPVLVLCAIHWTLFLGHALLGLDYGPTGQVGPFKGAIAVDATGQFRDYLINDILLIPAVAYVLALAITHGFTPSRAATLGFLLSTAYLAHTRGIWLGVATAAVIILMYSTPRPRNPRSRRTLAIGAGVVLTAALAINADPNLANHLTSAVRRTSELSLSQRVEQAPELWAGFERHPLLGSGLGATLPSGFVRSVESPWSFELTYLQMLFQLGLLGTLLTLAPAVQALVASVRVRAPAVPGQRAAAVGALIGLLLACSGNPYLFTSVGMLAVAIALAMADAVTARTPATLRS